MTEPVTVSLHMDLSWKYASGKAMERFLKGLKEKRIEALECENCGRRYLPPRPFCGNCHVRLGTWRNVDDRGVLVGWTVSNHPILDSRTGKKIPTPYGMGLIRLDGADTTVNHFLKESDPERLEIGQRVKAVWRDDLRGAMDDIKHFEVIT